MSSNYTWTYKKYLNKGLVLALLRLLFVTHNWESFVCVFIGENRVSLESEERMRCRSCWSQYAYFKGITRKMTLSLLHYNANITLFLSFIPNFAMCRIIWSLGCTHSHINKCKGEAQSVGLGHKSRNTY